MTPQKRRRGGSGSQRTQPRSARDGSAAGEGAGPRDGAAPRDAAAPQRRAATRADAALPRDQIGSESGRRRRLGWLALALGTLVTVFAVYVVYAAFPGRGSGLPIDDGFGRTVDKLLPQGWAFFTADPAATVYVPYRPGGIGGLQWASASDGPLAEPANGFGFDRSPRLQDQQVQSIVAGVDPSFWHGCPAGLALTEVQSCLDADPTIAAATNPWPVPALCGRVGVVAAQPVAWSSAHSGGARFDATGVLVVELQC